MGHIGRTVEMRNAYNILVQRPSGKRPLRKTSRSWKDKIRTDLKEIGWEGVGWVRLAQYRN
jgi:hypothetical protein